MIAFTIGTKQHARSPLIYGTNASDWMRAKGCTCGRAGGNRWSAWDWSTGLSYGGIDIANGGVADTYLDASGIPGEAARKRVAAAQAAGAKAFIVTVPMMLGKDPTGLIDLIEKAFPRGIGIEVMYELDNEPALWPTQFPTLRSGPLTYAELLTKSKATAQIIRARAPGAKIFGPVSYGMAEFENLQNASDAAGRNWLDTYLREMAGLVDVLDVHWYTEAQNGNVTNQFVDTEATRAARLQAPRELWDPTFVEPENWITGYLGGKAIEIIPRLREKIAAAAGVKLAITEYSYGGEDIVSGALAMADALGIMGREGVYAACFWEKNQFRPSGSPYAWAAMRAFTDPAGDGSMRFSDVGFEAVSSDDSQASVYASALADGRRVVIAINKTEAQLAPTWVGVTGRVDKCWEVAEAQGPKVTPFISMSTIENMVLPPMSVSVIVLGGAASPTPPPPSASDASRIEIAIDGGAYRTVATGVVPSRTTGVVDVKVTRADGATAGPLAFKWGAPAWDAAILISSTSSEWWLEVTVKDAALVEYSAGGEPWKPLHKAEWNNTTWGTWNEPTFHVPQGAKLSLRATRADGAQATRDVPWVTSP